ncbi:unnamed protein product [Trichogramma brassicae]|uniref:Uncharacterized protein n=1 Tax=Trichogramma brassicae TaxID=86971 RepID=A0A6H5INK4_9HYME|nr:unnamed protein product [Trichogramma brassicae]
MSTFWTFCAIFAALYGVIIVGSVSPLTILDEATFIDRWSEKRLVLSESSVENTTIYYALCDMHMQGWKRECTLYRNTVYSEDAKCNITLRSEPGGIIPMYLITIEPLGKDRAIHLHKMYIAAEDRSFLPYILKTNMINEKRVATDKWALVIFIIAVLVWIPVIVIGMVTFPMQNLSCIRF